MGSKDVILMFLLFLNLSIWTRAEMFSAIESMAPLIETQDKVIKHLKEYLEEYDLLDKKRMDALKTHMKIFEMEQEIASKDMLKYLANPINAYRMIKRLTVDLKYIEKYIFGKKELFKKESLKLPTVEDLDGALEAFARLHQIYRLNITEIGLGVLKSNACSNAETFMDVVSPMSYSDCYMLGLYFYNNERSNPMLVISGAWWLLEALYHYNPQDASINNVTDTDILGHLHNVYSVLGDRAASGDWYEMLISATAERYKWMVTRYREKLKFQYLEALHNIDEKINKIIKAKGSMHTDEEHLLLFEHLCRGNQEQKPNELKSLKCYYDYSLHASLMVGPVKKEQLYQNPEIILFHDVITDQEIQTVLEDSISCLERSQVVTKKYTGKSEARVSQDCMLTEDNSEIEEVLSRRVSAFTGLDMASAEGLRVINYGIGGHFAPHVDALKYVESPKLGNRIATVIFYFTDVTLGGATVFTELGLTIFPKKGSALFFMDLLPSGKGDDRTTHGACPVLHGNKWIGNKWIHERGQEFIRRCNLKP